MAGSRPSPSPGQRRRLELQVLALQTGVAAFYSCTAYAGLFPTDATVRAWAVGWIVSYHILHAPYVLFWRLRGRPIAWIETLTPVADVSCITAAWVCIGEANSPFWAVYSYALVGYSRRIFGRTYILVASFIVANLAAGQVFLNRSDGGAWFDATTFIMVVLTGFMALLAYAIGSAWRDAESQARSLADTDPLTGIPNRRGFMERLGTMTAMSDKAFAVLMVDLDDFKKLNDAHGHLYGDDVLERVADTLSQNLRPGDSVARYGGEEFVLVLPGAGLQAATEVGERLRTAVERATPSTISVGCAARVPGESAESVVRRADDLLLAAKRNGKNRVMAAMPPAAAA